MARAGKKFFTFILLLIGLILVTTQVAHQEVSGCVRIALGGKGNTTFYELSSTPDGLIWAIGRNDEDYILSVGTANGWKWTNRLNDKILPDYFIVEDLYAISEETAFLTGYTTDVDGAVDTLKLYQISEKGKKLDTLLSIECTGRIAAQQRSSAGFSAFSANNDSVRFLVDEGGKCTVYDYTPSNMSLHVTAAIETSDWVDAIVLHDGAVAFARSGGIISIYSSYGVHQYDLEVSGNAAALLDCGDSFYYLDDAANSLNEVGQMNEEYYLIQKIPVDSSLPLAVQSGGIAYWLEDGDLYRYDGLAEKLNGVLTASVWVNRGILAGLVLACALIAGLLTAILCGKRQVSMLIRSLIVIAFVLTFAGGIRFTMIAPMLQSNVRDNVCRSMESIAGMGVQLSPETNGQAAAEDTTALISKALEEAGLRDTQVTLFRYAASGYYVMSTTDDEMETDSIIAGSGILLNAKQGGVISQMRDTLNGEICEAVASQGNYLIFVRANMSQLLNAAEADVAPFSYVMAACMLLMCLTIILILFRVWGGIKRITAGVNLISSGEYDVELVHHSGDELEGLAVAMNNMARALKKSVEKADTIDQNYMRFIPEETINLLGVERLEDVSRETVSNHEMVTMTVYFVLPREGLSTEALFSEINEIIERTVFSAVAYGGNNFNFTYSSYNVVFEKDYAHMAFMAAVAIRGAVDALNKEREVRGKAPVVLRIAMDCGLVRLGIVGDELHMVPVAVSRCLDKNVTMLELSETLDAYITFTDTLISEIGEHRFRYVGQFSADGVEEKLYELYEGDPYLVAQRKRDTEDDFAQAMEAFYQRDFAGAKRILLQLARTGSGRDGAVRYYLNISDKYEQQEPRTLLLNDN